MSQHPSLKGSSLSGKFRSVLKRFEKIKELTEKEKWDLEKDSVYKIPKVKRIKFKVKKVKGPAEGEEGAETPEGEAGAGGLAGTSGLQRRRQSFLSRRADQDAHRGWGRRQG